MTETKKRTPTLDSAVLFIDVETGGLDSENHSLLQVAMVLWDQNSLERHHIRDAFSINLQWPEYIVTPKALEINKISLLEHDKSAVPAHDALIMIESFITSHFGEPPANYYRARVGGQNVDFDIRFMRRFYNRFFPHEWFDMRYSNRKVDLASLIVFMHHRGLLPHLIDPERMSLNLDHALEQFGVDIDPTRRHTAIHDAWGEAVLYDQLVNNTLAPVTHELLATAAGMR